MPTELLLAGAGVLAGGFGALVGLGGGVLTVPLLTLVFGLPLPTAVGTSLLGVIATSAGAAAINVRAGRADVRLALRLAGATVVGAVGGGLIAGVAPDRVVAGLFAALLAYTALTMARGLLVRPAGDDGGIELDPTVPDGPHEPGYRARRLPLAIGGSVLAGSTSALLGVGGGVVTVPLMHIVMGAPMRIAVATSNYMIGITASAGAFAYLLRGDVDARVAAPVILGVTLGAAIGAVISGRIRPRWLIALFVLVVAYVAVRMAAVAAA